MSALSPSVELGGQWPPLGIKAINPFELPLLNTVNFTIIIINVAVWVWILLYKFNLSINLNTPLNKFYYNRINIHSAICKLQRSEDSGSSSENNKEFYKWLSGFTDAEGSFIILALPKGFNFKFSIGLHIDDLAVLNYIKDKLGFGNIYITKNSCHFNVTKKEDMFKIINIFDIYCLNSSKYLDFLDLKKAYHLYHNRTNLTQELINKILDLKNNMNSLRINHEFSPLNISKSWLLGFIEGDGSFSLDRTNLVPVFSIKLSESQLSLLKGIKKYLEDNLGLDQYSKQKLNYSSVISISKGKAVNNSKPLATLTIKQVQLLNNYILPFLSECEFISKKGLDFKDIKIICKAIYIGAFRVEKIKDLIIKLSYTMNNYRLSTYLGKKVSISSFEINEIINAKATIEYLYDGLQLDLDTKKLIHNRSNSSIYEIIKLSGEILIKPNLAETAKELGIGFNTLKRQFDNQGSVVNYKDYKIIRLGVFKDKLDKKE